MRSDNVRLGVASSGRLRSTSDSVSASPGPIMRCERPKRVSRDDNLGNPNNPDGRRCGRGSAGRSSSDGSEPSSPTSSECFSFGDTAAPRRRSRAVRKSVVMFQGDTSYRVARRMTRDASWLLGQVRRLSRAVRGSSDEDPMRSDVLSAVATAANVMGDSEAEEEDDDADLNSPPLCTGARGGGGPGGSGRPIEEQR